MVQRALDPIGRCGACEKITPKRDWTLDLLLTASADPKRPDEHVIPNAKAWPAFATSTRHCSVKGSRPNRSGRLLPDKRAFAAISIRSPRIPDLTDGALRLGELRGSLSQKGISGENSESSGIAAATDVRGDCRTCYRTGSTKGFR